MKAPQDNEIILRDANGGWLHFRQPHQILCAYQPEEVLPVLEAAANADGWAAGYVSYEAAAAFDRALPARPGQGALAWFGVYDEPQSVDLLSGTRKFIEWQVDTDKDKYFRQIERIKKYIAEGETYQVNHTLRMKAYIDDPWHFFLRHFTNARFSAYLQTKDLAVCSGSPELFFELDDRSITCQPMKGTAKDSHVLALSAKDRAENVMIVDMIRNDLGRICTPGSIAAESLFEIEQFNNIWQMISTVKGESYAGIVDIFRALFPCASITGAPKRRTMQIIQTMENSARGIYCGAIGYIAPGRKARFSVAIRTAEINRTNGEAVYGVGGGIVWDSTPEAEWQECALKAELLTGDPGSDSKCFGETDFQLLETMLFESNKIAYQAEHIERLTRSAKELGFKLDLKELHFRLAAITGGRQRLRLLLAKDGGITLESLLFPFINEPVRKVCFAKEPVDPETPLLYHKTTRRDMYNKAKLSCPELDDVILWNTRAEVTESTIANVVVRIDDQLVTPPLICGLLPGTMRAALLRDGTIKERIITREELADAAEFFLINSLRGWMRAEWSRCAP